uniref:Uncharacterized protein n=1 Tax=Romanomermis culicivorax TaxID=13658 RepID=A0A915JFQ5_ROMCU
MIETVDFCINLEAECISTMIGLLDVCSTDPHGGTGRCRAALLFSINRTGGAVRYRAVPRGELDLGLIGAAGFV